MREIVLDTETTGGSHKAGDRVIDLGMVELIDRKPTGRVFQSFFCTDRDINPYATRVHGMTREMLEDQPSFKERIQEIKDFIGDARILAHHSAFDQRFMQMEFFLQKTSLENEWLDTQRMAKNVPGASSVKLDAVIKALKIDGPSRDIHGALLDAAYLAAVVAKISHGKDFDVDVAALVAAGDMAQLPEIDVQEAFTAGRKQMFVNKQRNLFKEIHKDVLAAYEQAENFRDFLLRIEAAGMDIRPTLSPYKHPETKERLYSVKFRIRSPKAITFGADHGLNADLFKSGPLAVRPEDHGTIRDYLSKYDRKFGTPERDALPILKGLVKRPVIDPRKVPTAPLPMVDPFKAAPMIEGALAAQIAEINALHPGSGAARSNVIKLRSNGMDYWSKYSRQDLFEITRVKFPEHLREIDLAMTFGPQLTGHVLRWMCRGLDPRHAVIMGAQQMEIAAHRRGNGSSFLNHRVHQFLEELKSEFRQIRKDRKAEARAVAEAPEAEF